jgi:hypothetical protein
MPGRYLAVEIAGAQPDRRVVNSRTHEYALLPMRRPGRSRTLGVISIPVDNQEGPAAMTTFPVQIAQEDNVTPADISINTAVTLYADGRIQVNSQAQEWTDLHGGHVGVVVLLYQNGNPPFWVGSTTPVRYGLDGKWIGTSQITTGFTQKIDPDTMSRVSYVVIHHYNAPNDAWTDVEAWLKGAQDAFSTVAAVAKNISSL